MTCTASSHCWINEWLQNVRQGNGNRNDNACMLAVSGVWNGGNQSLPPPPKYAPNYHPLNIFFSTSNLTVAVINEPVNVPTQVRHPFHLILEITLNYDHI